MNQRNTHRLPRPNYMPFCHWQRFVCVSVGACERGQAAETMHAGGYRFAIHTGAMLSAEQQKKKKIVQYLFHLSCTRALPARFRPFSPQANPSVCYYLCCCCLRPIITRNYRFLKKNSFAIRRRRRQCSSKASRQCAGTEQQDTEKELGKQRKTFSAVYSFRLLSFRRISIFLFPHLMRASERLRVWANITKYSFNVYFVYILINNLTSIFCARCV